MKSRRQRQWATALWFSQLKRKLPKTRKSHDLWCRDCQQQHRLMVYATWIWTKPPKRRGYNRFLSETIRLYQPWLVNNFNKPNHLAIIAFGKPQVFTQQTPEHISKLAVYYNWMG